MDTSRQLFAAINLLTTFIVCVVWWFAFARLRRARVFLALAVIQTFALIMSVDNIHLAFTERTFISFSSSEDGLAYFKVISYVQASMWLFQAVAYVFLVRWIIRNYQRIP